MTRAIGGLDVGTTGCKIALYDERAQFLSTYYYEYPVTHENGHHEIDFTDVRDGVLTLLKQATHEYQIAALAVSGFGETFAMLDEKDNILAPSMLYIDPRGAEECAQLCDTLGEWTLTQLTGVKPHPMYSIGKIMWQKRHAPEVFAQCKRIMLSEDFIVYTLTGVAQIDASLAARTAAFDIAKKEWSEAVFAAAGVDVALMSRPVPTGCKAGNLRESVKAYLGIDYDVAVVSGAHDQVAAMLGSGVFDSTQAMDGTGTVECIPVILEGVPNDPCFYSGGYSAVPYLDDRYACYAFSFTGGAMLKWFRDQFAILEHEEAKATGGNVYAELDRSVRDDPTGILVLPHFSGAATPYMDYDSKAAFVGITLETTRYDLYKALMEGTSYEMLLNFNSVKLFTGKIGEIRATGGGASSDVWLQIKADVLATPITALDCPEVGAAGGAALAGVAIGVYGSLEDTVRTMAPTRRVFLPDPERVRAYGALYRKYANLYSAIKQL